ncbi:non-ribosomal peptide synthase [Frankia casuarinae]|uniref:non-ribosomal peptide synthetase n=1 Tax=Frankia TaxID=1854 RepID=UPI0003D003A6|nr:MULTISPECIES: non-ribosomal peptide synthetase [Frankia]ETA01566.1 non-ribosomal peptide synthase [Frankia sp. CcI6]EYT91938.1 non-ribosomal peptide synthase [Frankia casuarinae]
MHNPEGRGTSPGPVAPTSARRLGSGAVRSGGDVERIPLSAVQHAMLLHSGSAPGEGFYVLQKLFTLREQLNLAVFEQALRDLFDWHPMLRTRLLLDHPDGPSQVVSSDVDVSLPARDWRQLDSATRQQSLREYLDDDKRRSFDFAAGPPMRFAVFRMDNHEYEFVWTTHHALMDGRSLFMVSAELFERYDHLLVGRRAERPRPRPYRDYVAWLAEQDLVAAESFWRADLAGVTEPTPFVVDVVRVPDPGENVLTAVETELSEEMTRALELLVREQQVTANNVVQAAWTVLLQQLSGRHDVVFGTTRACRGFLDGAQDMLGLFLNTLPFRVVAPSTMTVIELLKRLRRHQLALREFEHTSPTRIHTWSDIPASLPMFESLLIFENYLPATRLRSLGGSWRHREFRLEEQTNYPLTLYANHDHRLILRIGYDRRRFTDKTVERMGSQVRRLLEAMVAAPEVPLGALPKLAPEELAGRRTKGLAGPVGPVEPVEPGEPAGVVEHETDWVRRLMSVEPLDLPRRNPVADPPHRYRDIRFPVPADLAGVEEKMAARDGDGRGRDRSEWLLTVLLAFLVRFSGADGPDVDLSWEAESDASGGDGIPLARHRPFRVPSLNESRGFLEFRREVARQLRLFSGRSGHPRDLGVRHAELRACAPWAERGMPVAVELVDNLDVAAEPRSATVLFAQIPRDGEGCRWLIAENVLQTGAADTMRSMFVAFLEALTGSATADLTQLPLLSPEDTQRVLVTWNDTDADYPRDLCAHQLFIRQARSRPEAPAVVCSDRSLSYGELDRRSTRLAAFLGRHGIGPGSLVGIYLERSEEIVVAVLGVMKSGAAFVPLDPVYPPDRITQMLTSSGSTLLLTRTSLEPDVRDCPATVVTLDQYWDVIATAGGGPGEEHDEESDEEKYDRGSPEGRAYVIYTSGSTGRPKGVDVGHRALTNLLCSMARTPGFTEYDRLLAVTTVCFDIAYLELLLPLVTGGQVEVVPADVASDGFELRRRIERSRPTVMQATPATWRMLIAAAWEGDRGLTALCGGEQLPRDLADGLLARVAKVWNLYGPTETTIWSSVDRVEPGRQVTIGRPIANTRFYVLDRWLQPVPPGVPGELYIGGDGVAAGYLGEPELTRERFVRDPFGPDESAVMYRTGDIVRHLPDGRIDYLHRVDNQVKLHGYRIEPGEIEEALRRHDGIAEAVVCPRDIAPGNRQLVAYLVSAESGLGARPEELRRYLRTRLPPYMIPAAFVTVTRLPLTANGKIDRRSLPGPPEVLPPAGGERVLPRSELEAAVASIWRGVLGVPEVGIDENFFDAGGNSLLLMQVLIRLQAELSESLTRVDMFAYPTVRGLAAYLSTAAPRRSGDAGSGAPHPPGRAGAPEESGGRSRSALAGLRRRRGGLSSRQPPGA